MRRFTEREYAAIAAALAAWLADDRSDDDPKTVDAAQSALDKLNERRNENQ